MNQIRLRFCKHVDRPLDKGMRQIRAIAVNDVHLVIILRKKDFEDAGQPLTQIHPVLRKKRYGRRENRFERGFG